MKSKTRNVVFSLICGCANNSSDCNNFSHTIYWKIYIYIYIIYVCGERERRQRWSYQPKQTLPLFYSLHKSPLPCTLFLPLYHLGFKPKEKILPGLTCWKRRKNKISQKKKAFQAKWRNAVKKRERKGLNGRVREKEKKKKQQ